MSLFGRATFSAAAYAAARPTYPASLFRTVLAYHGGDNGNGRDTLLDLGCGHGAVAREMGGHFGSVVAVDPSAGMIKQADSMTAKPGKSNISFRQGSTEDLSFLGDGSVDMVVAGQSAHWFDYARAWPELARIVRPGGSLAFWGYKDNMLVGHPRANRVLDRFCYGAGPVAPGIEGMGPYWEQPGRGRLRDLMRDVEPPAGEWRDVRRMLYDVDADVGPGDVPEAETAWLRRRMRLCELEAYVRTFSAMQGWRDAHPDARSRAEGGTGDVADALMDGIVESEPSWAALDAAWAEAEVDVVWGTYIVLARRR